MLAAAAVLWACGDQNLFGPRQAAPPEVVSIEAPDEVRSGQTMDVRARAVGNVPLDSIRVRVRGGFSDEETLEVSEGKVDATVDASFDVPEEIADTTARVSAIAFDVQGNTSSIATTSVRIIDTTPPQVGVTLASEVVALGKTLQVDVEATDNVGLAEVGFRAFFTEGDTLVSETVGVSGLRSEERFEYQVPENVSEGDLVVEVFATDVDGNSATSRASSSVQLVFVDEEPPVVSLELPNVAGGVVDVGEEVLVHGDFSDNGGVTELKFQGLALRGDPEFGTDSAVVRFEEKVVSFDPPVADSLIKRFLSPAPADSLGESVHMIATATDAQGNVGADTVVVTLEADVDPPVVTISEPAAGVVHPVGDSLLVTADVSDPSGFSEVVFSGVALRGDPSLGTDQVVPRFEQKTVTLGGEQTNLTVSRFLVPVPDSTSEQVDIAVTATDTWGNVGTDTVTITLQADQSGPSVTILQPTAGAGFPVNDSILVEADVSEGTDTLESGITSVLFEGVQFTGDRSLGTFQVIDRYQPKTVEFDPPARGTINVTRFLQPTGDTTATQAFIRVTATDASGNQSRDSVSVQLGAPGIQIVTPEEGDEVAINGQITIRVEANDPTGIASLEVSDAGGTVNLGPDPLISETFSPAEASVSVEQSFNVGGSAGTIELTATAVNSNGIEGSVGPLRIQVVQQQAADNTPPEVRVRYDHQGALTDVRRMELTDNLNVEVEGRDNTGGSGVEEVGITLEATPRNRAGPTSVIPLATVQFGTPKSGTFTETLTIPVADFAAAGVLELTSAPDTVNMSLHAYMVDAQDNCGAGTSATEFQSLVCTLQAPSDTVASTQPGQADFLVGVAGQTVELPGGGRIADAVLDPDPARDQLVLSNIERDRLEVFDLGTRSFGTSILVGAEPWGMFFSRTNDDSLYVANSAGTNISIVDMASDQEDLGRRILTPNTVLWEVDQTEDDDGNNVLNPPEFFDFSDRPQFIAQDQNGSLLYSTKPTTAAPNGTIRLGLSGLGAGDTEVIFYTEHTALLQADQTYPLGNIDDITITADAIGGVDDGITVTDHAVGDESDVRTSTQSTSPAVALQDLIDNNADVYATPDPATTGSWNIEGIGLGDTTFVAASGDGSLVAIGEGATAPTGRILIYTAPTGPATPRDFVGPVSSVVDVVDLVGNQAERVLGVALNNDGTMGVARGLFEVYFFTPDLRLQGSASVSPGGAGVALHPLHNNGPLNTDPNVSLAFAGTGDRTVEVFDTRHFSRIGRVAIKQQIVGQIRAALPSAADQPAGFPSCTSGAQEVMVGGQPAKRLFTDADGLQINNNLADECVVLKLTGVTDNEGVVVIDVTKADIVRDHPDN